MNSGDMDATAFMLPSILASTVHIDKGHFGRVYPGVHHCSLAPWL